MAKLAQTANKYTVYARFEADGTVEKPDVIGAVFGQTEGLLGDELDLRELQRTGRLGRIDVDIQVRGGKASGTITIPSSLDGSETALIAACLETIDRVGPCNARVVIDKIEDVRTAKREYVIGRAKELLRRLSEDVPEVQQLTEALKEDVRVAEISSWKGLPSGPNLESNDEVIIVEGRADVLTLLRNGIKNSVAIEGTSVPPAIAELSKQKITTAFMDGDRGGDLIIKELFATCDLDFVCRAPRGKEVEELTKKELFKALRERVTGDQARAELGANGRGSEDKRSERAEVREHMESRRVATAPPETREREEPEEHMPEPVRRVRGPAIEKAQAERYRTLLEELTGTRAAYLLNEDGQIIGKLPVRELASALREVPAETIAFDGEADQRLLNMAAAKGVKVVVAMRAAVRNVPETVTLVTLADL